MANNVLNQYKAHPDAWTTVDKILMQSQSPDTKFFGLQILDEAVNVSSTGHGDFGEFVQLHYCS